MQLVASLRGSALEILTHYTQGQRSSYVRVAEALQQWFDSSLQAEVYRARLKGRARQQGEPLPQLVQDLETGAARLPCRLRGDGGSAVPRPLRGRPG